MVLLRRVIGDALRARRQGQHRTLREVSTAAKVSLGYLSEIERGQKEASSELLAAICEALGARLSELLGEVSDTLSLAEDMDGVLVPVEEKPAAASATAVAANAVPTSAVPTSAVPTSAVPAKAVAAGNMATTDGKVSVSVHQDSPLKATLRTTRKPRRDVVYAA